MGAPQQSESRIGKRRKRRHVRRPISRIDVSPMVGLALILLIMFIVAGPYLSGGAGLPGSALQPTGSANAASDTLSITVKADGKILLQDTEVAFADLVPKLRALSETFGTGQVFVRGDRAIDYGLVMRVMATIAEAGFTHIALITEPAFGGVE